MKRSNQQWFCENQREKKVPMLNESNKKYEEDFEISK